MGKSTIILLFSGILASLFISSTYAQSCKNNSFSNGNTYTSCIDLPVLNATLHWNYSASTGTVDIAYRHTGITTSRWIAWAINPTGLGMIGSQSLVAYQNSSGLVRAYTSSIDSFATSLAESSLSFGVSKLSAEQTTREITIYATLELPGNVTTVNQVWQDGPLSGSTPAMHSFAGDHMKSMSTINFLSTTGNA